MCTQSGPVTDIWVAQIIAGTSPGKNNELQLTDALSMLAEKGTLHGFEISGTRYDIGNMELWIKSFLEFLKRDERFNKLL